MDRDDSVTEDWYCPVAVSVADRLPEINETVLAFAEDTGWVQAKYFQHTRRKGKPTEWYDLSLGGFMQIGKVTFSPTHWIELPPHPDAGRY